MSHPYILGYLAPLDSGFAQVSRPACLALLACLVVLACLALLACLVVLACFALLALLALFASFALLALPALLVPSRPCLYVLGLSSLPPPLPPPILNSVQNRHNVGAEGYIFRIYGDFETIEDPVCYIHFLHVP
ncbi:hypothetical protein L211DRAFT_261467 [Terfezia boudieri ATCC MYA-4762]|uniref:Uncharacterized protein n=1 Tax=Terfezia boudieri ATCC MYA-4762 TaxID=1051890 RepID=A0A3N4M607_9PEZI|nr:hypothetical protein L211DRAFT_261467 [Terfezia boudieri ATCC MYA-4762]